MPTVEVPFKRNNTILVYTYTSFISCVLTLTSVCFSGPYLKESLNAFVGGHWSVSRQLTKRHYSGGKPNLIFVENFASECSSTDPLPIEAYAWLVKHLSQEGDAVVNVFSSKGDTMAAALMECCNAIWLSDASNSEQASLQTKLSTLLYFD